MEGDYTPLAEEASVSLTPTQFNQMAAAVLATQRLEDTLTRLQAEVDALRFLHPTPSASPAPAIQPPTRSGPKVNSPEPFNGDRLELETYLCRCEHVFLAQPQNFRSETQKVLYASTYLKGNAYSWFKPLLQRYSKALTGTEGTTIPDEFSSWQTFSDSLTQMYGDPVLVKSKTRELNALKQTTSVSAYASEFRRLQAYVHWNDQAFFDRFYDGLRDNVKDGLVHENPSPIALDSLIASALRIDTRIFERILERKSHPPTPSTQRQAPMLARPWPATSRGGTAAPLPLLPRNLVPRPTPAPPIADAATPMELDSQRFPILTPEQKEARKRHRIQQGLCLYCGSATHRISECPSCPPPRTQRVVSSLDTSRHPMAFEYVPVSPDLSVADSTNYQTQQSTNGDAHE